MGKIEDVIQQYLDEHKSHYLGKYRYRCSYRIGDTAMKFHYYMLDESFRNIDIYVELSYGEKVDAEFSENLNDQEKQFIIKDALVHIFYKEKFKHILHYSLIPKIVKEHHLIDTNMAPIDYIEILEYMKYHQGINQKTIDSFYEIYLPVMHDLIKTQKYDVYICSLILLLRNILYEYDWDGPNSKYRDTEYQYHLYYVRELIQEIVDHLDVFYKHAASYLFHLMHLLCQHTLFAFCIMSNLGSLFNYNEVVLKTLSDNLKKHFILYDKEADNLNQCNLVYSYLFYSYLNKKEPFREVIKQVFRTIVDSILVYANHDLDLALGNTLLKNEGYDVLLDLFSNDYNTFIFTCFPISSFPTEMRTSVRNELVAAIRFFAGRMNNDKYKLSSFEQVLNINRLLLDNFGDWYK